MPPRDRTVHVCQQCDYRTPKWLGRCPDCGAWASLIEQVVAQRRPSGSSAVDAAEVIPYPEIPASDRSRNPTGIDELDRVLGGGLIAGAVVLVGGEPGIGTVQARWAGCPVATAPQPEPPDGPARTVTRRVA